mgnify:CR=1 FL=1
MYPYNRNTQLYHSRAKETQAEKPSLLSQDKRLEELLSLARTEKNNKIYQYCNR